jgi:hypothetical protein
MQDIDFHHLLNHSLMEERLLQAFPEKDFINLELPPSTLPCILQGLPRDLNPLSASFLQLKPGFTDLKVLKKRILDKPILHLFKDTCHHSDQPLLTITYVVPGGFGDFYAQRHLKKILKKKFYGIRILSLIFLESSYCNKVQTLEDEIIIPFTSQESLKPENFSPFVLSLLQQAFLIFEIPTPFPFNKELKRLLPIATLFLQIGEYGYIQSKDYRPSSSTRCLGLHFLEYGLFEEEINNRSLEDLSQKDLACYLFSKVAAQDYQKSHNLYFSYLATDYGSVFYFYLIIYLSCQANKTIDFVCVDIGPFLKLIEQDINQLKTFNIRTIEIFYKNQISRIHLSTKGLDIRIIHTGHLGHADFQLLLNSSQEPVGVRGNLSFSEALSLKKIFFYDPLSHNYPLYYGLLSLAKIHSDKVLSWMQLFKPQKNPQQAAYEGSCILQDENFKTAFENLCCFILKNLKAEDHLINIVFKAFYQSRHPLIKKKEQDLTTLFLEEKISFFELSQALKKEIIS